MLARSPLEAGSNGSDTQAAVIEDLDLALTSTLAPDPVVVDGTAESHKSVKAPDDKAGL